MIDNRPSVGDDVAIVNPVVNARTPKLGPVALMVSPKADLYRCHCRMPWLTNDFSRLYLSRLYTPKTGTPGPSLVGPMIGAPYAGMILESLIAWGCQRLIFFGWCGAIDGNVRIGDIIIPTEAVIDEGTSRHYIGRGIRSVKPALDLTQALFRSFSDREIEVNKGSIWSTDAVYRETKSNVRRYQQAGVLGVDMEISALFSIGRYRSVDVAGVLVVSDELSTLTWRQGFKTPQFAKGRKTTIEALITICQEIDSST